MTNQDKKCEHGQYYNGNGTELPCPVCHQAPPIAFTEDPRYTPANMRPCECNGNQTCQYHLEEAQNNARHQAPIPERNMLTDITPEKLKELKEKGAKITELPIPVESWEVKFDGGFPPLPKDAPGASVYNANRLLLKQFIHQILLSERQALVEDTCKVCSEMIKSRYNGTK